MILLLLLACSEYELKGETPEPGGLDTSSPDCPPSIPDCVDTDETGTPTDSAPPDDPDDCAVTATDAGTIAVLEACDGTYSGGTVTDPYNLEIEYAYTSSALGIGSVVKPTIINLTDDDGDGRVTVDDIPDIVFTVYSADELVVLSGDGAGEILVQPGWYGGGDLVTADVDADGDVEICGFDTRSRIRCVDAAGRLEWTSSARVATVYPHITACDVDQDGRPEIIGDSLVVNGEDGTTAFTLDGASPTIFTVPVCADIDRDGTSEIIHGDTVYDHRGDVEWTMAGGSNSRMAAVVNVDSDDDAEVFLASDRLYLYDTNGTQLNATGNFGSNNPGPPCAADFDGDGEVEIAVPASAQFYMFDTDGTELWRSTMQDVSGLAGCSGYDMDGDGIYEVLFADEVAVRLYNGVDGSVLYESSAHNSLTLYEYPVVADVDNDGSAEIVIAENGFGRMGITVYGHAGDGWPASGPTWASHDFAVTNIEADGTVPQYPEESWLTYNVFRARPAVDDPSAPDLLGEVVDVCVADCDNGPIKISVQVRNQGGADVEAGVPWAFYRIDADVRTLATTGVLPRVPMGTILASFEIAVAPADVGSDGFVVVLDDDGTGLEARRECDATNNEVEYRDVFCP